MNHPAFLLFLFIFLIVLLQKLSRHPTTQWAFEVLPVPFWCYVVPMMLTTMGWIPGNSPLYPFLSRQLLPVCLVLLLIGTDLKAIARLGPMAIALMVAGAVGTIAGGLISFFLYHHWLPEGTWAGIGALSASWIGGSANLLAVKEALGLSDTLVAPLLIVDALVAYSWMALLLWASSLQGRWDRWLRVEGDELATRGMRDSHLTRVRGVLRPLAGPSVSGCAMGPPSLSPPSQQNIRRSGEPCPLGRDNACEPPHPSWGFPFGIILSILISLAAQCAARHLPAIGQIVSASTWTVLLVTTATLILSLTPLRCLEDVGSSKAGTFALFVLLCSIGARANFAAITEAPVFLALGVTWILIHGLVLLVAGYFLKGSLGLIATASQANIGGPISAPIVGATYHPELAGIGLLMAILGNILGTYCGILTALTAKFLTGASI